ncbi:MAG: hypothetical protein KDA86_16480 [Planctomycetaceae bacterium]|nr:hypothetical protein [Planctomycetaceae bacterium]
MRTAWPLEGNVLLVNLTGDATVLVPEITHEGFASMVDRQGIVTNLDLESRVINYTGEQWSKRINEFIWKPSS